MRWVEHTARMEGIRNAYKIFVGIPEGKRPVEVPRHRENNIEMDLKELGYEGVDWIHLAHNKDRWRILGDKVMNLQFP
jgi:hypothetical protein